MIATQAALNGTRSFPTRTLQIRVMIGRPIFGRVSLQMRALPSVGSAYAAGRGR